MASSRLGVGSRGLPPPPPLLLLLLLLLGPWPAAGHGGKYSREKNEPEPPPQREPGGEFRMEKLNQLWEKAQRLQLSPVKLSELHADLKMQEREEFAWKKLKAEGLDADGERAAKLLRNLSVILAKYGLDGRKDAQAVNSNYLSDTAEDDSLGDPKLEKLWHKAKSSGKFSSEELAKLWRELQHHREKVHEYNVLLDALSRTEETRENVISPLDVSRVKEDVLHSKHAELKDRLRAINQGYDRLRQVSHRGYGGTERVCGSVPACGAASGRRQVPAGEVGSRVTSRGKNLRRGVRCRGGGQASFAAVGEGRVLGGKRAEWTPWGRGRRRVPRGSRF
ncbi:alpha-2-macroglobulin receptor-associated protein isoform X1 [Acinonyx jubatus]|uniref:Alpha-2-macroglobulin receptor-associated protein isoform X1 n=1 Tax=Acinonyx jubatus TaxID=32536 RepID=A0ABM3PPM9_ACIJB|nr:alpha-2-macroglobulin receptor-associated protein isoform X1 [Acinonyx jubatus]